MRRKLNILIAAGPTQEPIDPLRFISNYSTGTIGYEIAKEARARGYNVTLISGPTGLTPPKGINFLRVQTALQMREGVNRFFKKADCLIMAAAVSDYRPAQAVAGKISKNAKTLNIRLVRNPDILLELSVKKANRIIVGFCLETKCLLKKAVKKLRKKNLDLIVANQLSKTNNPFGDRKSNFLLIEKEERTIRKYKNISKRNFSKLLLDRVEAMV